MGAPSNPIAAAHEQAPPGHARQCNVSPLPASDVSFVCYRKHMRLHITLDDGLVAELDRRAGSGHRSSFIARTVERALEDERRWEEIEASLGSIEDRGHDWDDDPAAWVKTERRGEARRVG